MSANAPAGRVKRKKGRDAPVEIRDSKNVEEPSMFIVQVGRALSWAATGRSGKQNGKPEFAIHRIPKRGESRGFIEMNIHKVVAGVQATQYRGSSLRGDSGWRESVLYFNLLRLKSAKFSLVNMLQFRPGILTFRTVDEFCGTRPLGTKQTTAAKSLDGRERMNLHRNSTYLTETVLF